MSTETLVTPNHSDTKCPPVFGLPSSCSTALRFVRCWLPQEGVDTVGVWRSPELDDEEEVVMFTMIGVKMFVGVRPVRPSMRALKSSWFITLVGVSMGMLRLLRLFDPLPTRRLDGRFGF